MPLQVAAHEPQLCLAASTTVYPPLLQQFIARLDPDADDFVCEQHSKRVQEVLDLWNVSFCKSPAGADNLRPHLAESFLGRSPVPSRIVPIRTTGPLTIEKRFYDGPERIDRETFAAHWVHSLASLASVETFDLEIYGIREASQTPLRVSTDISFVLVGTGHDGGREQRAGTWHLDWVIAAGAQAEPPNWQVQEWLSDPETRSRLTGPGFADVTGHWLDSHSDGMAQLLPGIDHWRTALDGASGIDVYGNHGIGVGDIDASGYDSFYVCQPSGLPNRLYRNRGDGSFEDITEASGTGILDGTASALFVDFQNRGVQDLLVVRSGGPLLFSNLGGGRFEPRPGAFHFARPPQGTFTSAAVADYNCDGLLDVYFCVYSYYKGLNHHQYPTPYYDAQNGPPNFLFRNRGDGTFEDITESSGMNQNNNRFSFAAAWCDFDNDGWPDVCVANDFGRKNLYRNNGDGTFTDVAAKAGTEDYGPGMSTCWLDSDNDGLHDLYIANMWLAEGRRITADDHFLPGVDPTVRALYQKHNAGNSFFRNAGKGSFKDKTSQAGMAMGGWSWSCASWDFDNDGWPDVYVANGFVSGPNRFDLQSFFWRQVAQRSFTPSGTPPEYEMAWNAINELVRSDYSWSGYQRNVFFANHRDGDFSEVAGVLGLDLIDDSRAYALSDFDHDGRLEFVLKNRTGPQLKILRNNLEGIGNSIAIRLAGTQSNRDAIGAVVTIQSGANRQTKFVSAGSGFASQHTKELFFGLGESAGPITISVRWPTGKVDHHDNLSINHRVQIEEGKQACKSEPYRPSPSPTRSASAALPPRPASGEPNSWLIAPLFGPDLRLVGADGKASQLTSLRGRPVLLTFVRPNCGQSLTQVEQLQTAFAEISAAGIALFTVAVVDAGGEQATGSLAQLTKVNFPIYPANARAVGAWNIQYRYMFDRRQDMPLPISFLLDVDGAIVRVYRGAVSPHSTIDDWRSMPQSAELRFAHAMPFPGAYFGEALKHDYLSFGIAFSEYGYLNEAEAAFQRAIDSSPGLEVAWFNLGTIYLNKKMYPEARKCLSEAVRLNPLDSDAWNNLGSISGMEQKLDEALDEFKHAALADPNHANAVENMMSIYSFQGRSADAQKSLEELIAHAPDIARLHLSLSIVLVAQNNLERAREELETSLRLNPSNPDAVNNLGAVLLRLGRRREALEQFELCRRLAPDFVRATINAAVVYSGAGQREHAQQVLSEFLARHPDAAEVRRALDKLESN